MKTAKKVLSIFLAFLMIAFILPVFASAEETVLQFGTDGKFQIMIFSDIQDDFPVEETTLQFMNEALDKYQPDLVVYLGDNSTAMGDENEHKTIESITEPCVSRNVPYAIVFGNHDGERETSRETLLDYFQEFGCLTTDADPDIYGCGNSNLTILSSDGKKTAFNLWFIDSNAYHPDPEVGGYDYVREDQIQWYKDTADALKAENGGKVVPSMLFQHIIMPEAYEAIYPRLPFKIGKDYTIDGTTYFPVPFFNRHAGIILEPCSPPFVNGGQWDALVETGDVIATFFGHDHVNDFIATHEGIDIVNVPTVGYQAYSDAISRGAGLITLDEKDLSDYEYEMIYFFDMAREEDSKLTEVEGGRSRIYYSFVRFFRKLLDGIHNIFLPKEMER
ncbi:MAG: metallophosphoesterase family protein [Clostridia bacterium]|nr:metallophosphoesterase family protein [Clostridia bacterium]